MLAIELSWFLSVSVYCYLEGTVILTFSVNTQQTDTLENKHLFNFSVADKIIGV